jgi:glucokinase
MESSVAIGIDVGATNLKGAVVDRHGRILARLVQETAGLGPDEGIKQIAYLVGGLQAQRSLKRSDVVGIGIGAPGPLSQRTGRIVRSANMPGWVDVPIRDRLREELDLAVTLDNDGNAAAFGEYWAGAGRDGGDLVMLTLGTGVGAGVVLDGRVLHGHFENAAELGHIIVAVDGLPCPCGQHGCLEQYASAGGVARRVVAGINTGEQCVLTERVLSGQPIDAERVVESARAGDPLCLRVFDEACLYLGIACVNIQHAFNPARIVLGGGMSQAGALLVDRVAEYARRHTWSLHGDFPVIALAELGYDAGVIGAAGLAWQEGANR